MKLLILGTVICLLGAFASTDTGITSKRDPRFFFGLRQVLNPDDKNALVRQLRNEISVLRALVTALQPLIATNARRCPTAAATAGARRIGDRCFLLVATPATYLAASRACAIQGGRLAEPPLGGLADFATSIRAVFPTAGVTNTFIGLLETDIDSSLYQYSNNGEVILAADALIDDAAASTTFLETVLFPIATGFPLVSVAEATANTLDFPTDSPYICEYDLI